MSFGTHLLNFIGTFSNLLQTYRKLICGFLQQLSNAIDIFDIKGILKNVQIQDRGRRYPHTVKQAL